VQRQVNAGHSPSRQGIFLTSQESTANYYADLAGIQGRAGGPAVVRVEVPTSDFRSFMHRNSINYESSVPQSPLPGQTETMIPASVADEFNSMINIFHHP
jgi:hypothetical protein